MRKYHEKKMCFRCGKLCSGESGFCDIRINWDYFSNKDGEDHRFILCETCYDGFTKEFIFPVRVTKQTELL